MATQTQIDQRRRQNIKTLVALAGSGAHLGPIARATVSLRNELLGSFVSSSRFSTEVARQIMSDSRERLLTLVSEAVERLALTIVGMNDDAMQEQLDLDMAFEAAGVPLDPLGQPMPDPKMPADVRWSRADVDHVMRWISPLVVLTGDTTQNTKTPLTKLVRGDVDHTQYAINREWEEFRSDEEIRRQTQAGYRSRARRIINGVLTGAFAVAIANLFRTGAPISRINRFISNKLGIGVDQSQNAFGIPSAEGGLIRGLELVIRDRAIQVLELDRQRDYERISRSLLVGYELRSVLIPTTRPSHAQRDGWRFYRDNREGSDLPWNRRIIPPYAHNCLCYTRQLWEPPGAYVPFPVTPRFLGPHIVKTQDVGAWTFERGRFIQLTAGDVGRSLGPKDTPRLTARDAQSWQAWFDNQSSSTKSLIVGERRILAVQSRGTTSPAYADLVDEQGRFLSPRRLLDETNIERRQRRTAVRRVIRAQARRSAESPSLKLTGAEEKQYRRRLELFLKRVSTGPEND